MTWYIVVPSLKISGGNIEAIRLCKDLIEAGGAAQILCMWQTQQPLPSATPVQHLIPTSSSAGRAIFDFPRLLVRFRRWFKHAAPGATGVVFTHYATLPLSVFVPRQRRCYFVQDLEWHFVGSSLASRILRAIILSCYRRGRVLSANAYLTSALRELGVSVAAEVPIWADAAFLSPGAQTRDIDYVMVLRTGAHKRLDLYRSFIAHARSHPGVRIAAISPDDELVATVRGDVDVTLLRPSLAQMRELYSRSKCFVHLSEHEGFGLPPLEAMGAGCVPLCRDSGGVRAFMRSAPLAGLLLPLHVSVEALFDAGQDLIAGGEWQRLSEASREIFRQGLDSAQGRVAVLKRLGTEPLRQVAKRGGDSENAAQ